jgi:hypothetical protein
VSLERRLCVEQSGAVDSEFGEFVAEDGTEVEIGWRERLPAAVGCTEAGVGCAVVAEDQGGIGVAVVAGRRGAVSANDDGDVIVAGERDIAAGAAPARLGETVGAVGECEVAGAADGAGIGAVADGDRNVARLRGGGGGVAVGNRSVPSIEICISRAGVVWAGTDRPPSSRSIHEYRSLDGSAEATPGAAIAAAMPSPVEYNLRIS